MEVFLNLALFVGVFYLIIRYAGLGDRRTDHDASPAKTAAKHEKRVA